MLLEKIANDFQTELDFARQKRSEAEAAYEAADANLANYEGPRVTKRPIPLGLVAGSVGATLAGGAGAAYGAWKGLNSPAVQQGTNKALMWARNHPDRIVATAYGLGTLPALVGTSMLDAKQNKAHQAKMEGPAYDEYRRLVQTRNDAYAAADDAYWYDYALDPNNNWEADDDVARGRERFGWKGE